MGCVNTYMTNRGLYVIKSVPSYSSYLHCCSPREIDSVEPLSKKKDYSKKIEPVAPILKKFFQRYTQLPSRVAIDEMMIKIVDRTGHSVKIERKPIKQRYKIYALWAHGYIYNFSY